MNHREEHMNEEMGDAPLLRSLPRQEPWEAPEGYFDRLPGEVMDRVGEEALLDTAPLLRKAGRNLPAEPPAGYFDHLPQQIRQQVLAQGAEVKPLWQRWASPRYLLSIAAALLLLLLGLWVIRQQVPSESPQQLAVTADDLILFAEQGEIDPYAIAAVLDLSKLDARAATGLSEEELDEVLLELDPTDIPLEDSFFEELNVEQLN